MSGVQVAHATENDPFIRIANKTKQNINLTYNVDLVEN